MSEPQSERPKLDKIDRRILRLLQADGRMSNKDIAEHVSLSPTPCLRRTGILEDAGYIKGYQAVLDPVALGYNIRAFVNIKRSRESSREEIAEKILAIPEVLACHTVSGEFDMLVELVSTDMEDYARIVLNTIADMRGVYDVRTTFAIRSMRVGGALPLPD